MKSFAKWWCFGMTILSLVGSRLTDYNETRDQTSEKKVMARKVTVDFSYVSSRGIASSKLSVFKGDVFNRVAGDAIEICWSENNEPDSVKYHLDWQERIRCEVDNSAGKFYVHFSNMKDSDFDIYVFSEIEDSGDPKLGQLSKIKLVESEEFSHGSQGTVQDSTVSDKNSCATVSQLVVVGFVSVMLNVAITFIMICLMIKESPLSQRIRQRVKTGTASEHVSVVCPDTPPSHVFYGPGAPDLNVSSDTGSPDVRESDVMSGTETHDTRGNAVSCLPAWIASGQVSFVGPHTPPSQVVHLPGAPDLNVSSGTSSPDVREIDVASGTETCDTRGNAVSCLPARIASDLVSGVGPDTPPSQVVHLQGAPDLNVSSGTGSPNVREIDVASGTETRDTRGNAASETCDTRDNAVSRVPARIATKSDKSGTKDNVVILTRYSDLVALITDDEKDGHTSNNMNGYCKNKGNLGASSVKGGENSSRCRGDSSDQDELKYLLVNDVDGDNDKENDAMKPRSTMKTNVDEVAVTIELESNL